MAKRELKTKVTYWVEGLAPLIVHSPYGMMHRSDGVQKGKNIPPPEEEAEQAAYRLEDGQLAVRSCSFIAALFKGAVGRKIGSIAVKTVLRGVVSLWNTDELCGLVDPDSKEPISKYEIDIRPARVQNSRVLRARPMMNKWACKLELGVDSDFIAGGGLKHLTEMMNVAGRVAGVGELRPGLVPWSAYGTYTAVVVKE